MTVFASRSGGPVTGPLAVAGVPPAGTDNTRWKDAGACRGEDQAVFFPPDKTPAPEAKAICARCPVRDVCLEYALGLNIQHGIWGGKSIHERRKIREQRYRARLASAPGTIRPILGAVPSAARPVAAPARPLDGRAAHHP